MIEAKEADTIEYRVDPLPRAPTGAVRVEFAAATHPGLVRANNEDHFAVTGLNRSFRVLASNLPDGDLPGQVDQPAYGMIVADGMGGMAAGEKASQLAIRTLIDLVLDSPRWATRIDDREAGRLMDRMRDYLHQVDTVVIGEARADLDLSGMGTTLTVAYTVGADVFIVHVGDSRAYLFRDGELEQLTRDHTMAQDLADAGAIRPDEVNRHSARHVLTNFVGGPSHGVDPEIATLQLRDGDVLLLCSDGLTDMVDDGEIAGILRRPGPLDALARALVGRALEQGGRDNVTVVVARYEIDPPG